SSPSTEIESDVAANGRPAARRRYPAASEWQAVVTLNTVIAATAVVLGFVAIGLAWYHAGNTDLVWVQMQELLSGGLIGVALIVVGTGFFIRDNIVRANARATEQLLDIAEQLAEATNNLASATAGMRDAAASSASNGPPARARRTRTASTS